MVLALTAAMSLMNGQSADAEATTCLAQPRRATRAWTAARAARLWRARMHMQRGEAKLLVDSDGTPI